jgi:hypothetical protein
MRNKRHTRESPLQSRLVGSIGPRLCLVAVAALLGSLSLASAASSEVLGNDLLTTIEALPEAACGGSFARCIMTPLQTGSPSPVITATHDGAITKYELRHGSFTGPASVQVAVVHPSGTDSEGHKVFSTAEISGPSALNQTAGGTQSFTLPTGGLPIGKGDQVALIAPASLKVVYAGGEAKAGSHGGEEFTSTGSFSYPLVGGELAFNGSELVNSTESAISVSIGAPVDGATYSDGQVVDASFSCTDNTGHVIKTCKGTVEDGKPIDTSTAGKHSFTVTSTDSAGNSTEKTVAYTVTAFPAFWTNAGAGKTLLHSVTSPPKNQPDALEFINNGTVTFQLPKQEPVLCNEVTVGTTVLVNNRELETKLALPFGVAEADSCTQRTAGATTKVPTYFDTAANGVVPATITVTGPPLVGTVHKLKLSQNKAGTFCTVNLEGVKGELKNVVEGFVEESPPNLNLEFAGAPIAYVCGASKFGGTLLANFFLETMSTTTDTAFIE